MNDKECKVCGDLTKQVFNIAFEATAICENCEAAIVKQSVISKY
jgi:predicted nucleic acid-binding Zn ribbon protein